MTTITKSVEKAAVYGGGRQIGKYMSTPIPGAANSAALCKERKHLSVTFVQSKSKFHLVDKTHKLSVTNVSRQHYFEALSEWLERAEKDCLLVITAVWFSPQLTCLMLPLQKCSSGFGKSTWNRNVPWPSWPYWPLPNVYTLSSAAAKDKWIHCTVLKYIFEIFFTWAFWIIFQKKRELILFTPIKLSDYFIQFVV